MSCSGDDESRQLIEQSYADLSQADKAKLEGEVGTLGKDVRFHGFDGNNERHYHIASYMIDDMHRRFQHFKGRDLNSHRPSIEAYRRMYAVFAPMRANLHNRNLGVNELTAILKPGL
jgi:uncharacterized protein